MERLLLVLSFFIFHFSFSVAQTIKIGGNVYGGGNAGKLTGNTKVTVYSGELNNVFGGARMADVEGHTFVNLDGEHASDDVFIVNVYGGNDIAGKIGEGSPTTDIPTELENIWKSSSDDEDKTKNKIDNTCKTFVRTSACKDKVPVTYQGKNLSIDANMLVVGALFGGGNGDYIYKADDGETDLKDENGNYIVKDSKGNTVATNKDPFTKPDLSKTYLEIKGGDIAHVYGGGNNATVTGATTINIDNSSNDLLTGGIVFARKHPEITDIPKYFQSKVTLTTFQSNLTSWAFNHARVFGGNNKAPMDIMPKWNLQRGIIRDLYSGGNEGPMNHENGLVLEVDPSDANKGNLFINNVYGGCRRADVRPLKNKIDVTAYSPDGYKFPPGLSARVIVRGGQITNVYGGNDISGKVYGGNAVGIYTTILGDVYGGGNGSYAYTDNAELGKLDEFKDFYYDPGSSSVDSLNAFRPNAEQVSLRLYGSDPNNPVIIYGGVFVGGNSATLKAKEGVTNPMVELKIGSNVIANNVFLGNNGENMVKHDTDNDEKQLYDVLPLYSKYVGTDGKFASTGTDNQKFSTINLASTNKNSDGKTQFDVYMDGCAMNIMPRVVFDTESQGDYVDYIPYSTSIGSFYCGGNVGSMTKPGTYNIDFTHKIIIFDKLVGGSNNAVVQASDYNAFYEGGIIGDPDLGTRNKLVLNLSGLKIRPKRWNDDEYNYTAVDNGTTLTSGKEYFTHNVSTGKYTSHISDGTEVSDGSNYYERGELIKAAKTELIWNTVDSRTYNTGTKKYDEVAPVTTGGNITSTADDLARRLYGGNIYGGCCESGVVDGNVVINLNETIVERDVLFDKVAVDPVFGEEDILYGETQTEEPEYTIEERRTGVILGRQGMDVFGSALNVFGGGKGKDTEIWGSTVVNLNAGYTFQIFGGSEDGVIGKPVGSSSANDYVYSESAGNYSFNGKLYKKNENYSCYVNLCGTNAGVSKASDQSEAMAECEFMYGGGFFGPICGNTVINMGNGRIFNSFAGSCNGDILGTAETFMGRQVTAAYKAAPPKNVIGNDVFEPGFPWVRDIVYGANDLGGRILGENNYKDRVRGVRSTDTSYSFEVLNKVHNPGNKEVADVLKASAYVEYLQGRADAIFGGCYGTYDFKEERFRRYTDSNGEPLTFDKDTDNDGNNDPKFFKPRLNNAFVNFRPTYYNQNNVVNKVFGAGQGQPGETDRDKMQNRSYVLIDIPQIASISETSEESEEAVNFNKYKTMEVFGAGAWGGVGMGVPLEKKVIPDGTSVEENPDNASAIIDLVRGNISSVFGGSYEEGITRRTVVNVPQGSTILMYSTEPDQEADKTKYQKKHGNIFGGAYGTQLLPPCDVYESNVNYHSSDAVVNGAIYGGNNNERRTIFTHINIDCPVWSHTDKAQKGYLSTVYGAGQGVNTWAEHTEVNLLSGAQVYEVYGGGMMGHVLNVESVQKYMTLYKDNPSAQISEEDEKWKDNKYWNVDSQGKKISFKSEYTTDWQADWYNAWDLGDYYTPNDDFDNYAANEKTNLSRVSPRPELDAKIAPQLLDLTKYNTNVIIHEGAYVGNYGYGGGYGKRKVPLSGDVYGTTYITLLGGTVKKDLYASGTAGSVYDLFGVGAGENGFTATANAYVRGGTVRNVYGGGWRGSVGYHPGAISDVDNNTYDRDGHAHVVIGHPDGVTHANGIPSVTRNVYGGGEGGAIYGDAHVVINKGYIGYRYVDGVYKEELDDTEAGDNKLLLGGNVFGGGYVANSYVDRSYVDMWEGVVRGSLYGGGEIGPIGRGTVHTDTLKLNKIKPYIRHNHTGSAQPAAIYKGGETHVYLWGGHVMRDVFGGGRGYDNWNGEGYFESDDEKNNMDRSSKGYVFGFTDVHIRGGEIGTEANTLQGHGNVFGGGNEGFVYSAEGVKVGEQVSDDDLVNGVPTKGGGFYYKNPVTGTNGDLTSNDGLSLDCYIAVEPYCKVTDVNGISGFTANAETGVKASYAQGEYVPVEALNQLKNRNNQGDEWAKLDTRGITIHNALFAGGNITEGSDNLFANTVTVYGNAAASLRDVYNYDLISLGNDDFGGLYGDGNLTLVDGFRELHIDNYGTDYYSLDDNLEIDKYNKLTDRQKAYYKLMYVTDANHTFEFYECKELHTYEVKDGDNVISSTTYKRGQKITETDFLAFPEVPEGGTGERDYWTKGTKTFMKDDQIEESEYVLMHADELGHWKLYGVTSIYAGRPLNTIQRADMCGVYGSRMVLKGAEDRVINTVDYHSYTINRVDEVSLNRRTTQAGDTDKDAVHGNYFGIYNEVNFLGNLTSDVFFTQRDDTNEHLAIRRTDSENSANKADVTYDGRTSHYGVNDKGEIDPEGTTYYEWKAAKPQARNRNNGISHNMVALASGVHLEIKREEGEAAGKDDWGYITGVVELDLINVMPGMGGGYVYARNEHGIKTWHGKTNPGAGEPEYWGKVTLLAENEGARTYRRFEYTPKTETSSLQQIETSGNFVHNTKEIVDDCYPNGGVYKDGYVKSPAHYWFIRGQIYVYDQYISAFTGSANAYAEKVELPLTISAASNGRMMLREVQPNYYAYYDKNGNKLGDTDPAVNADETIIINNATYRLNDPVSYWEYRQMTDADKSRFVEETYVVIDTCKVDDKLYLKGEVMLPSEYKKLKYGDSGTQPIAHAVEYEEGGVWKSDEDHDFDYFFRMSNNLSHNTGYVLTYDVNNPMVWDNYYTLTENSAQANRLNTGQWTKQSGYTEGPTFTPKSGNAGVHAQYELKLGDIVYATTKTNYDSNVQSHVIYPAVTSGTTLTEGKTYYTSATDRTTAFVAGEGVVAGDGTHYESNQATVTERAYVVTKEYSVKDDVTGVEVKHLNVGTPIYEAQFTPAQWTAIITTSQSAKQAKVCTTLLEFSATDYIYAGKLMTETEVAALKSKVIAKNGYKNDDNGTADAKATAFLATCFDDAYYCTEGGLYGGTNFVAGHAYSALESWCSMTADERLLFDYNYDALDLLVDPTYSGRLESNYGNKSQYDGTNSPKIYSVQQPIDYQAEFAGYEDKDGNKVTTLSYTDEGNNTVTKTASSAEADWLKREVYEDIPNEKHHYSPITVTAPGNYYVVKNVFMRGDIPYTVGQVVDETSYLSMTEKQKENLDQFEFTETHIPQKTEVVDGVEQPVVDKDGNPVYVAKTFYYCRENYIVNEKGEGVAVTTTAIEKNGTSVTSQTYTVDSAPNDSEADHTASTVPQGAVIDKDSYEALPNFQQGFIIHGMSPTETSTLYVSSESDIHNLSKEKIITVIYLYEYEESDESGQNVVPVSERHIVNIHIDFKSGVPEIGDITKPGIVLPGTTIGMNIPSVSQGAYRVTESGWELFDNESDARTHTNGKAYTNNEDPVFWYQNGYWIAYYAQTYLGKTYSNSVPISVANFHDLAKVWGDKDHHYYIDHKDMDYEPKIYINDYKVVDNEGNETAESKNGLDLFKNLIDLSYKPLTYNSATGEPIAISEEGPLKGHVPLDNKAKPMQGGAYLKFFLNADQDHSGSAWTPIANETGECFSGVLHGDGHTVSGLSSSLFNHLCGEVYNLGVTGSFSGAGVAETGEGYVENCWIHTTGTPDGTVYAVFGNPTASDADTKQIVNSYCQATKTYKTDASGHGLAKPMPEKAFYNGEVAYDLNGFYLWKRYSDQTATTGTDYRYFTVGSDNSLTLQPAKHYASDPALCSSGYNGLKYVEDRFTDGDFIYVGDGLGTIPSSPNERLYTDPNTKKESYHAIWPDDYIFFGQTLSYGYMDGKNGRDLRTHQPLPAVINKSGDRVLTTDEGNRVYRAPAYFRSSKMGVAHFNPYAVFAAYEKLTDEQVADGATAREAYKDMTAIDFTGYNDASYAYQKGWNQWSETSQKLQSSGLSTEAYAFYPPLLDDGGLSDFFNADLTRNLLAYTMTTTAAARKTDGVVAGYLPDEAYTETESATANSTYSDTYRYHTVAARDTHAEVVRGHRVQKQSDGSFLALNDHVLIDRQDFNAPMEYSFASEKRMWYQRTPDNYVDIEWSNDATPVRSTKGWEGISLPFKAEIVTTNQKGELTHFYRNTDKKDDSGHEYWLRGYEGGSVSTSNSKVFEATFHYPDANPGDGSKDYTNTFLWDHYYSHNNNKRADGNTTGEDQNDDEYQEDDAIRDYYKYARTYSNYPRMAGATPYIIGFPGSRYYEFDLSGTFEAQTAHSVIPKKLEKQAITFASKPGATTIEVSDNATGVNADNYTFMPSYLNETFEAGTTGTYTLNAAGNSYDIIPAADVIKVSAFRPFFIAKPSASRQTRSIVFSQNEDLQKANPLQKPGFLSARAGRLKIVVTSTLQTAANVRIVNTSGQTVTTFTIEPGQIVETPVLFGGVYIVQSTDGSYIRKLAVK